MPFLSNFGAMSARGFGMGLTTSGGGPVHPTTPITLSTPGTSTWTVPAGVTSITVEGIGGGQSGGGIAVSGNQQGTNRAGGWGGSYAKTVNLTVTPGATVYYHVGTTVGLNNSWSNQAQVNGDPTWLNISVNSAPTSSANGILAASNGGTSYGTTTYIGGTGHVGSSIAGSGDAGDRYAGGGGGGAAGPTSAGGNSPNWGTIVPTNNGGSAGSGTLADGTTKPGGGSAATASGGGGEYTGGNDTGGNGNLYGQGGGGGGTWTSGTYVWGCGQGAQGVIVIS